jgi:hypothetical protein
MALGKWWKKKEKGSKKMSKSSKRGGNDGVEHQRRLFHDKGCSYTA